MTSVSRKKILIAPLDWGLGHAARCIPVIQQLIAREIEVIIGGSGLSGQLLQHEFPQLKYVEIPGYDVSYSSKLPMAISMLRQAPGIIRTINEEKKWLDSFQKENKIDAVISDHRYGLYNKNLISVFIAHQLFISSGNAELLEPMLWKINKSYIGNFDVCWIPDIPGEPNASGKLSHKLEIPFNHYFVGILSRIKPAIHAEKKFKAAIILSGPEPLRTELEKIICSQLFDFPSDNFVLIRGTQSHIQCPLSDNVTPINLADALTTNTMIQESEMIISRSGYSSIMDYLSSNSKALLIPTPGQTEQEYLAEYHLKNNQFYSVEQSKLQLVKDLPLALTYQPQFINNPKLLDLAIGDLIKRLN